MSAYSEWKYGLITDAEYATICKREEYEERFQDETNWEDEEVLEDDEIDEF